MLLQDDAKGRVMIGEAVLRLALAGKEITVVSLVAELRRMAGDGSSADRQAELSAAVRWLQGYITAGHAEKPMPRLKMPAGLNVKKN